MALVSADLSFGGFPVVDDVTVAPAGQLGAGLRYDVNRAITLDLGYRMKSVINATLEAGNGTGAPHSQFTWFTHIVQGGISFHM